MAVVSPFPTLPPKLTPNAHSNRCHFWSLRTAAPASRGEPAASARSRGAKGTLPSIGGSQQPAGWESECGRRGVGLGAAARAHLPNTRRIRDGRFPACPGLSAQGYGPRGARWPEDALTGCLLSPPLCAGPSEAPIASPAAPLQRPVTVGIVRGRGAKVRVRSIVRLTATWGVRVRAREAGRWAQRGSARPPAKLEGKR
jgi:hypothetical protein